MLGIVTRDRDSLRVLHRLTKRPARCRRSPDAFGKPRAEDVSDEDDGGVHIGVAFEPPRQLATFIEFYDRGCGEGERPLVRIRLESRDGLAFIEGACQVGLLALSQSIHDRFDVSIHAHDDALLSLHFISPFRGFKDVTQHFN
jgi:hypothetical protein